MMLRGRMLVFVFDVVICCWEDVQEMCMFEEEAGIASVFGPAEEGACGRRDPSLRRMKEPGDGGDEEEEDEGDGEEENDEEEVEHGSKPRKEYR